MGCDLAMALIDWIAVLLCAACFFMSRFKNGHERTDFMLIAIFLAVVSGVFN